MPTASPSPSPRRRALLALLWITCVHTAGLYLFTTGFFLTRFEVPDVSECHAPPPSRSADHASPHHLRSDGAPSPSDPLDGATPPPGCWMPRRFRRVVFVVVDALRFDFVQSASAATSSSSTVRSFYLNHLPVLNATLHAQPAHALLLKFVADAPTMTMQRLKGLTTGGLPTFLDIKDNMASSEITEDNLLLQMQRARRPVVFMGDDTWEALYRNAFARQYAFDSFNVKDLHSVDRGVERHLFPELRDRDDWELLIAHFLGVDHVGHTHGPSSPFMAEKLDEMDAVLARLLDELARPRHRDTLLVVMGDHGMSADGNHGGASDDETGAALFAYSAQPLVDPVRAAAWPQQVPQVDLVPTLALLAGLPIPFGSLGAVIPQLFLDNHTLARALKLNVAQVRRYLLTYSAASKLPQSEFDHLERLHDAICEHDDGNDEDALAARVAAQQAYLREALALGRSIWTQFDLCGMGWGLALLVAAQALVAWHLAGDPMRFGRDAVKGALAGAMLGAAAPAALAPLLLPRTSLARALALAALGSCVLPAVAPATTTSSAPSLRRSLLTVPTGASLVAFVTVLLHALALLSNSYIVAEDRVMHFLTATVGLFLLHAAQRMQSHTAVASALIFLAVSRVASAIEPPNIIHSATSVSRTWLPLAALVGAAVRSVWIDHGRHGRTVSSTAAALLVVAWAGAACASYWLWSPLASPLWRLWLPRSVFVLAAAALMLRLRAVWTGSQTAATKMTAPLALLLTLSYALVLGPSAPLTVLSLAAQHASFARVARECGGSGGNASTAWPWLWCAACYASFFATGHQNTFTSLQNAAAFVGFDDFRFYWAGALLGANTFGNYALALAALVADPLAPSPRSSTPSSTSSTASATSSAARALLMAVAYFALNALVSTAFVALQRRHLMVWAIFAPKFIFDSATLLVVELLTAVTLAGVTMASPSKPHTPPK